MRVCNSRQAIFCTRLGRKRQLCNLSSTFSHRQPRDKLMGSSLPTTLYQLDGLSDYSDVWMYQRCMVQRHLNTKYTKEHVVDALILTEHKSVYTLGRGSSLGALSGKNRFVFNNRYTLSTFSFYYYPLSSLLTSPYSSLYVLQTTCGRILMMNHMNQ